MSEKQSEAVEQDSYREAAEFYLARRVAPGEDLPVERYLEAKRRAERMPQYSVAQRRSLPRALAAASPGADLGGWQPLGPGNVGGRTRSLAIHPGDPKTMYAGAVGGGVWKTTDGGGTWTPLADLLPSIGISTLAMDPQDPNTLYAGTGEWYTGSTRGNSIRGLGIFKTTDGGATWSQLAATNLSSFYYVNKIVISPNNSLRIYAATYGGIWQSVDGGATWSRTLNRASPYFGCQDMVIRTDQATDYVFASCLALRTGTASGIFRNTDAANAASKWEQVFTSDYMDRVSLALAPSNQAVIYALAASSETGDKAGGLLAVYRSSINGDAGTWETRASSQDANRINQVLLTNPRGALADVCTNSARTFSNQGDYDNVIAVDPLNPDVVWAGGIDVFRSDDGGANWGIAAFWQARAPQLVHADVHVLAFAPGYNGNDNQTLFAATDGGIYRTDNALAAPATGDGAGCFPYSTQIVWSSLNNGYSVTQFYHGAVYPGGAVYAGGAQDNGTNRGSDGMGANNWQSIGNGGDGGYTAVDPANSNNLYVESQNFNLIRSANGGLSFLTAKTGITEPSTSFQFVAPFEMDPNDSKTLYAGGHTLWRTSNGAQLWTAASAPIDGASGSITAIAIAPADSNRVVFGTSAGFVYRSSSAATADNTTAWDSAQPRTGYLSKLAFDPGDPNVVYATYSQFITSGASQNHVYKSIDGGATWTGIDGSGESAIPDIPVFSIVVDPQNSSNLYLGTDIGVFASLDGGVTWVRDNNPFANAVTETLVLDRSAGQSRLFAFTHGRGVWRTVLPGSGDPCQYQTAADPVSVPAFGATLSFDVGAGDGCNWSAVSTGFTISPGGGRGKGTVTVTTGQNTTTSDRNGMVSIQDKIIRIHQEAAVPASGNDDRAAPFDVSALPMVVVEDTSTATEAPDDPPHSCTQSPDFKTVWLQVTANDAGSLRLSFAGRRLDTGTDSGAVMSVFSAAGTELVCSVSPQATSVLTTRSVLIPVKPGDTYLVELSATTFKAPDGAAALPGSLLFTAQILKQ